MTGIQIAALAYLVIGLGIGAFVWAAVHGDVHTCDECDPTHENRDVVEWFGFAMREPRTRVRIAVSFTVALAAFVVAWPVALLLGVVLARREGKR